MKVTRPKILITIALIVMLMTVGGWWVRTQKNPKPLPQLPKTTPAQSIMSVIDISTQKVLSGETMAEKEIIDLPVKVQETLIEDWQGETTLDRLPINFGYSDKYEREGLTDDSGKFKVHLVYDGTVQDNQQFRARQLVLTALQDTDSLKKGQQVIITNSAFHFDISSDGEFVVYGDAFGNLVIFDTATRIRTSIFVDKNCCSIMRFSPKQHWLFFSGDYDVAEHEYHGFLINIHNPHQVYRLVQDEPSTFLTGPAGQQYLVFGHGELKWQNYRAIDWEAAITTATLPPDFMGWW